MNFIVPLVSIALMFCPAPTTLFAAPHPGTEVIEGLHAALLAVMKDGQRLGYRGRYEQLSPVIRNNFDLPFIARTVLGRYWDGLKDDQKSRFVEEFSKLTIATYAANFDAYSREQFKVISQKELRSGQIEIKTKLLKSDGEGVSLDYILHRARNEWRIINIIANGVSDLALKRADYTNYLRNKGFDALLGKLEEKVDQYLH
jgi:phospholipid transport system substrate-binding protein